MSLRGLDHWLAREPDYYDDERDYCPNCERRLVRDGHQMICERCDEPEPEWEPDPEDRS